MTCIVAVKTSEGAVVLGADSAGVAGNFYTIRADPKLYEVEVPVGVSSKVKLGYGFDGSYPLGQLVRYWVPPAILEEEDCSGYMITKYVPRVRQLLKDAGRLSINDDGEEKSPGALLVALQGNIFKVEEDFQVAEFSLPFMCIGLGENPALGFLYAHYKNGDLLSVEETIPLVEGALEASSAFCQAIKPPWITMVI